MSDYDNDYDDHDGMTSNDLFTATELHEMDRDLEHRLDAEDDARNTAEIEAEERAEDTGV